MKSFVLAVLVSIVFHVNAGRLSADYIAQARAGALAKIELNLKDEGTYPVSNALVSVRFSRTGKYESRRANSDVDGRCVVENRTCGNSIEIVASKTGYYVSRKRLCLIQMGHEHMIENGSWMPYPLVQPITLRKILSPISDHAVVKMLTIPVTGEWCGFDLKEKQFTKPYGDGEIADLEFCVNWDGLPPATSKLCKLGVRIPGVKSGGYYSILVAESEFPYSYGANEQSTFPVSAFEIVDRDGDPHLTKTPFRSESELVMRSRCVLDEFGRVKESNYSSIRGISVSPAWNSRPTIRLSYVFNPTVNNTNLEAVLQ